jgi:replicative superfamily II helicase
VNLPARRVIFKHAWVGFAHNVLDATKYRQMAGRAGRAGIDTEGEAVLIASKNNNGAPVKLKELMQVSWGWVSLRLGDLYIRQALEKHPEGGVCHRI